MRLRRGTSPILYELYDGNRAIGRLCRTRDGAIVLELDGFLTAADAASAGSLAYSGLLAYHAQRQLTGSLASGAVARPSSPWSTGDSDETMKAVQNPDDSTISLRRGDVEVAQLHRQQMTSGGATWSIRIPLGSHDTPEVFLLAAARRTWEAVRRAGRG